MTTTINLTPHPVNLRAADGSEVVISPTAPAARVEAVPGPPTGQVIGGIPVHGPSEFLGVIDLPEPAEDTVFIVSLMVAERCPGRTDVFSPGTGPKDNPIRNERGHVVAVTRLVAAPSA